MAEDLNPLSYVVLGMVGRGGAGAHDVVDMMRRGGRLHWAAAESKLYAEPKRLERLGYLRSREEPGRTRARRVYELTPEGEGALRAWLREPTPFPRIQSEAAVRMMAGDLADDGDLLSSLVAMRGEIALRRAALAETEAIVDEIPHRTRNLRLVLSLGDRVLDAHEAWLAEVERELGGEASGDDDGPAH
ncbi:MAG: PadR family transcriptional regulator [Thermoleophilia bacterium]